MKQVGYNEFKFNESEFTFDVSSLDERKWWQKLINKVSLRLWYKSPVVTSAILSIYKDKEAKLKVEVEKR